VVSFSVLFLFVVSDCSSFSGVIENETIKTRTIRYNEQQQNGMKPLKLEQSDKTNNNKTEKETTKTTTIKNNEKQKN
jgi:hypothetical protein